MMMIMTTTTVMIMLMMIVARRGAHAELLTALRELEAMSGFQSLGSEQRALLREMVTAAEHCKLKDFLVTVDSITLVHILASLQANDGHDLEVYLSRHLQLEFDSNGCTAQTSPLVYTTQSTPPPTTRKVTTPFYIQHRPDYTQPPTTLAPDCNPPGIHCIVGRAAADTNFKAFSGKKSEPQETERQNPVHSTQQTPSWDIFGRSKYEKGTFNPRVQKTSKTLQRISASTTGVWSPALDEHPSPSLYTPDVDTASSKAYGSPATHTTVVSDDAVGLTSSSING